MARAFEYYQEEINQEEDRIKKMEDEWQMWEHEQEKNKAMTGGLCALVNTGEAKQALVIQ